MSTKSTDRLAQIRKLETACACAPLLPPPGDQVVARQATQLIAALNDLTAVENCLTALVDLIYHDGVGVDAKKIRRVWADACKVVDKPETVARDMLPWAIEKPLRRCHVST